MSVSPIAAMFDRISPKYDRLNHLLSLNIDKVWRRKTAKAVAKNHPATVLDLATGTGDLAIALAKRNPQAHIIGMDISERMLDIGIEKVIKQGLESQRVLRPDGLVFILEFSMPEKFPMKQLYRLYFKHILPKIGKRVSKDHSAYTYLPQSVEAFPKPDDFLRILGNNGLKNGSARRFSFGIVTLYTATK